MKTLQNSASDIDETFACTLEYARLKSTLVSGYESGARWIYADDATAQLLTMRKYSDRDNEAERELVFDVYTRSVRF